MHLLFAPTFSLLGKWQGLSPLSHPQNRLPSVPPALKVTSVSSSPGACLFPTPLKKNKGTEIAYGAQECCPGR